MKKILVLFLMILCSFGARAACSGDVFTQECFDNQNITGTQKANWGNPSIPVYPALTKDYLSGLGQAILSRQWQCGTCQVKGSGNNGYLGWDFKTTADSCSSSIGGQFADDESIVAYVATEFSDHGAKFCLRQFTASTLPAGTNNNLNTFVVRQYKSDIVDVLFKCRWFCYKGWDGERCMTEKPDTVTKHEQLLALPTSFTVATPADMEGAAGDVVVLDYRSVTETVNYFPVVHEDVVVVMATSFDEHGIKARPVRISSSGGRTSCIADNLTGTNYSLGKHIDTQATRLFVAGYGNDHTLCLQGYTGGTNGRCEELPFADTDPTITWCSGWKESLFDSTKFAKVKVGAGNNACYQWRCRDGKSILDKAGGTECTWYVWSPQRGVNPENGTGVQCPSAMVFNANVHGDGVSVNYCEDTIRVSGDVLLYGNGSSSTTWDKQCWTKTNPEEYKKCVALGVK